MNDGSRAAEVEVLIREIQRYLAIVEAFRAELRLRPPRDKGGEEDS
jgi:hypothetical protein